MPRTTAHGTGPALAALSTALVPGAAPVQLTPDGTFRAVDGRPEGLAGWQMSAAIAAGVLARLKARATRMVINYEHPEAKGEPLPAAGWIDRAAIHYEHGTGLVAPIQWTARARAMIDAGEYGYLSPVIAYDQTSGAVTDILFAGLTNTPALDSLAPLAALAQRLGYVLPPTEDSSMDKAALRAALGLPDDADDAAIQAAMTAAKMATEQVARLTEQVTALKAAAGPVPDPALFVPRAVHDETVAALRQSATSGAAQELSALIEQGMAKGQIPGQATADWLRGQGLAACRAYLAEAPEIAALKSTQTGSKTPAGVSGAEPTLAPEEVAVCAQMGLDQAAFLSTRKALEARA